MDSTVSAWENRQDRMHSLQPDFATMTDIKIEPVPLISREEPNSKIVRPKVGHLELNGVGMKLLPTGNRHD